MKPEVRCQKSLPIIAEVRNFLDELPAVVDEQIPHSIESSGQYDPFLSKNSYEDSDIPITRLFLFTAFPQLYLMEPNVLEDAWNA